MLLSNCQVQDSAQDSAQIKSSFPLFSHLSSSGGAGPGKGGCGVKGDITPSVSMRIPQESCSVFFLHSFQTIFSCRFAKYREARLHHYLGHIY